MPSTFSRRLLVMLLWLAASYPLHPAAQEYPVKPLRMIVPAPAGSPPDVLSRWYADRLSASIGQPIVIDNRVGAGGIIGVEALARSAADGYTIGVVHQGHLAFNPFLYARTGYDPLKDFTPIARILDSHLALAVHTDLKAATVSDFVRLAKDQPGGLTFGSAPIGSPPHMADQLFQREAGYKATVVPYKAGNFALADLAAGRVHYTLDAPGATLPHAQTGKVRILAVSGARRLALLPDVPTIAESGIQGYAYVTWFGVAAPAGVPAAAVKRLNEALAAISNSSDARNWGATQGLDPVSSTPEAFAALIRSEYDKWGPLIRQSGIRLE